MASTDTQPVAIVTGAGRGIGGATAVEMARRGWRVTLAARTVEQLERVANAIEADGGSALVVPTDVTVPADVEAMVERTVETFGRLDVLVNNAAMTFRGDVLSTSLEDWDRVLATNLTSVFLASKYAVPHLVRAGSGAIIHVSSIVARRGAGHGLAYGACKGAIDAMTYDMAVHLGPMNIRVVSVQPGAIDTEISRQYQATFKQGAAIQAFAVGMTPLGRWGQPEEIARVIAFLASDDASFITGTTVLADGGWLVQTFPRDLSGGGEQADPPRP